LLIWFCFVLAAGAQDFRLNRIVSGLTNPTDIQAAGDGSGRLFFVQQNGIIRVFRGGVLADAPFLDIRGKTNPGGERGLLGLAFPPDYANKGYFYVNYTDRQGNTVIARYRTTANPDVADPSTETVVMNVAQPFANHNGGQLRFGPDGYLYIGLGDGGSAGDPQRNGQNRRARLGKMLRVDVESDLSQVRIPPSNPFVNDSSYLPEIWALGLRNPWRYSFDRSTGDLWIADVGQNRAEEIDFQPASSKGGENYGWNQMEGFQCYIAGCNSSAFTLPVLEYGREQGCSVTGGHVYRGSQWSNLQGLYVYADYCTGRIWGLRRENNRWVNALLLNTGMPISTFGEAEDGEIYVANIASGEIFQLTGKRIPSFSAASVVNAASNVPGLVPGSAATIYAAGVKDAEGTVGADRIPLPGILDSVQVTVNGRVAPLYAVARVNGREQINFQVPFETETSQPATVIVRRGTDLSGPVTVPVLVNQPGIFTTDGTRAIVVHADNTLVSSASPLGGGESVYFYVSGLGAVDNTPATGQGGPRTPLARALVGPVVTVGGRAADVFFAGLAPDFVGLYQVNFVVPQGLAGGDREIVVTAGGVSSPAGLVAMQ
jgi:uncharacterized protein (TIGR03437 family)